MSKSKNCRAKCVCVCVRLFHIEYRSEEIEKLLVAVVGLRRGRFEPLLRMLMQKKMAFLQCPLKLCPGYPTFARVFVRACVCRLCASYIDQTTHQPKRYSNLCCHFVDNEAHVIDNSAVTTTNNFIHSFITSAECSRKMCSDMNMAIIHQIFGNIVGVYCQQNTLAPVRLATGWFHVRIHYKLPDDDMNGRAASSSYSISSEMPCVNMRCLHEDCELIVSAA